MLIKLDDNWAIKIDQYHNHTPHRWSEVKKIPEGAKRGAGNAVGTGEWDWHSEDKHFASIEQAIRLHIIPKMLQESVDVTSYEGYHTQAKDLVDYFNSKLPDGMIRKTK